MRFLPLAVSPRLTLVAGLNLNMNAIREGADAYFECEIRANPRVFKVQWSHNVSKYLRPHQESNSRQPMAMPLAQGLVYWVLHPAPTLHPEDRIPGDTRMYWV